SAISPHSRSWAPQAHSAASLEAAVDPHPARVCLEQALLMQTLPHKHQVSVQAVTTRNLRNRRPRLQRLGHDRALLFDRAMATPCDPSPKRIGHNSKSGCVHLSPKRTRTLLARLSYGCSLRHWRPATLPRPAFNYPHFPWPADNLTRYP